MWCSADLLDVVVGQGAAVLELLSSEDQSLLVRGDTLLVLDLGLDIIDSVGGLDLKGNGLARQGLHEAVRRGSVLYAATSVERRSRSNRCGAYICTENKSR